MTDSRRSAMSNIFVEPASREQRRFLDDQYAGRNRVDGVRSPLPVGHAFADNGFRFVGVVSVSDVQRHRLVPLQPRSAPMRL
jgi:hypothetical protein